MEIDEKAAAGELSDPVNFSEAQRMPYLQAVIQESLRLYPAVGDPLGRVVPEGGIQLAGRYFPEGVKSPLTLFQLKTQLIIKQTVLGINAWVAHTNKDVFGEDADQFKPERWLVEKEAKLRMDRYFLPASLISTHLMLFSTNAK